MALRLSEGLGRTFCLRLQGGNLYTHLKWSIALPVLTNGIAPLISTFTVSTPLPVRAQNSFASVYMSARTPSGVPKTPAALCLEIMNVPLSAGTTPVDAQPARVAEMAKTKEVSRMLYSNCCRGCGMVSGIVAGHPTRIKMIEKRCGTTTKGEACHQRVRYEECAFVRPKVRA